MDKILSKSQYVHAYIFTVTCMHVNICMCVCAGVNACECLTKWQLIIEKGIAFHILHWPCT